MAANLTQNQIAWGDLYCWLHNRAEYLRRKKAESAQAAKPDTDSAKNAPTQKSRSGAIVTSNRGAGND